MLSDRLVRNFTKTMSCKKEIIVPNFVEFVVGVSCVFCLVPYHCNEQMV